MLLLDTNVVSEVMRPAPDSRVLEWLDAQATGDVWISAVTVGEIRWGIELLPDGRRRERLAELADAMFHEDFAGRCLPYDLSAAVEFAEIVAVRTRHGKSISVEDGQIAGIARSAGITLATRNIKDFASIERLPLVNPWA